MDYKYENERTLRISLTFEDLEDHEIRLVDFLSEQEKVEDFFFELVDELDLPDEWLDNDVMTFQIRPHAKGIDLFVSDDFNGLESLSFGEASADLEEFLKQVSGDPNFEFHRTKEAEAKFKEEFDKREAEIQKEKEEIAEKNLREKEKEESEFVYYTLTFPDFATLLQMARAINAKIDESELYDYQNKYYLTVLDNQKKKGVEKTMALRAAMLEYAEEGTVNRETLREHAKTLLDHDALKTLQKI